MDKQNPGYLLFIVILSVFALAILAAEAALPLSAGGRQILQLADTFVCVVFLVDFVVMVTRAKDRRRYLLTWGWLDLLSSIPMVSVLRWGRLARVLRIFRVLRAVRSARVLTQAILQHRAQNTILAAALLTILLVSTSAALVLHFEAGATGNIHTPEDAVWWSITTITTVGYGDRYPVTTPGRIVASILMAAGVGLFGTFSGLVASWFMAPARRSEDDDTSKLREEISELRGLLAGARTSDSSGAGGEPAR